MQTSFGVNMLALVDGVPRTLNLADALTGYVDHQIDVVTRRSEYRLRKAKERDHIVEGLIRALDVIDAIITLIRASADTDAARQGLMAKPFEFSEIQANHILDMPLRRLAQLEQQKLKDEHDELQATIKELESILQSDAKLRTVIKEELAEVKEEFAEPRRSQITLDAGELADLDFIEDEEVVLVLSHKGYVKTVATDAFRKQGRGGKGVRGSSLKDEDYVEHLLTTTAHSYLLFFSTRGRVYRLRAHEIPMKERTARGTALVNLIALGPDEKIQAIIDTRTYEDGSYLFFATKRGQVKKTKMSEYDSSLRTGLIAINLKPDDELVRVIQTTGDADIFMVSRNGMTIRFSESDVRSMGRAAAGVRGMKLKNAEDAVVSCDVAADDSVMLFVSCQRAREAHQAGAIQPSGPGRPGRAGHEGHGRAASASWRRSWCSPTTRSSCSPRPAISFVPESRTFPPRAVTPRGSRWRRSATARASSPWLVCSKLTRRGRTRRDGSGSGRSRSGEEQAAAEAGSARLDRARVRASHRTAPFPLRGAPGRPVGGPEDRALLLPGRGRARDRGRHRAAGSSPTPPGAITNVEKFMGKILSSKNYHLVVSADPRGHDPRRARPGRADDDPDRRRRRALQPLRRARRRLRGHARGDRPPALSASRSHSGVGRTRLVSSLVPQGAIAQPVRAHP